MPEPRVCFDCGSIVPFPRFTGRRMKRTVTLCTDCACGTDAAITQQPVEISDVAARTWDEDSFDDDFVLGVGS